MRTQMIGGLLSSLSRRGWRDYFSFPFFLFLFFFFFKQRRVLFLSELLDDCFLKRKKKEEKEVHVFQSPHKHEFAYSALKEHIPTQEPGSGQWGAPPPRAPAKCCCGQDDGKAVCHRVGRWTSSSWKVSAYITGLFYFFSFFKITFMSFQIPTMAEARREEEEEETDLQDGGQTTGTSWKVLMSH